MPTSQAPSNVLTRCLFCICAAVGGKEEVVQKETAQKDEFNWPWQKEVGVVYVNTSVVNYKSSFRYSEVELGRSDAKSLVI